MNKTNKIAVILCSYNGEKYINEQINSILNQNNLDIDLFIYDDNSLDLTVEKIQKNKKIYIVKNSKNTGSHAINFLTSIKNFTHKYQYYCLADQDDIWDKNKLIAGITKIENNYDCYSSSVNLFKDKIIKKIDKSGIRSYDYYFESAGPGCTYIFSDFFFQKIRNWLNNNEYMDIKHHDWFIYCYARHYRYNWYIDNSAYIYYRLHQNNIEGPNYGINNKLKRLLRLMNGDFYEEAIKYSKLIGYQIKLTDLIKRPFDYRRKKIESIIVIFFYIVFLIKKYKKLK